MVDVAGGELADPAQVLAVEEDEEPCDAVDGVEAVIVQKLVGVDPSLLGVVGSDRAVPGWYVDGVVGGMAVVRGPA
ncbi:MAG: hypothetical protein L0Y54_18000 [Sporichthyaceae bacterium]|nr:hypothetical protein [Sporichthyaceae bacterium]